MGAMSVIGLMLLLATQEPEYLLMLGMPPLVLLLNPLGFAVGAAQFVTRLCCTLDATAAKE